MTVVLLKYISSVYSLVFAIMCMLTDNKLHKNTAMNEMLQIASPTEAFKEWKDH